MPSRRKVFPSNLIVSASWARGERSKKQESEDYKTRTRRPCHLNSGAIPIEQTNGVNIAGLTCLFPRGCLQVLGGFVRKQHGQLGFGIWHRPYHVEHAQSESKHLLVLGALAPNVCQRHSLKVMARVPWPAVPIGDPVQAALLLQVLTVQRNRLAHVSLTHHLAGSPFRLAAASSGVTTLPPEWPTAAPSVHLLGALYCFAQASVVAANRHCVEKRCSRRGITAPSLRCLAVRPTPTLPRIWGELRRWPCPRHGHLFVVENFRP